MSAELLREAAALMRSRAQVATPGPWEAGERIVWRPSSIHDIDIVTDGDDGRGGVRSPENAEHIASWHPAVALAVADWLDAEADLDECARSLGARGLTEDAHSVKVARAYLGRDA